jgi:hypothetical protein
MKEQQAFKMEDVSMTGRESRKTAGLPALPLGAALWLTGALITLALSVPVSAKEGAHPYQRWADEFGLDMNVSYDGIRTIEFSSGTFEAIERRAPGKMYTETQVSGMSAGVILREDLGKSYILMPSMGFYREESLEGVLMQTSNGLEFSKIEKVGREEVNGHQCTKFKTKFKDNEGKGAGMVWVTDTGVPMKMDMIYSNKDMKGQRFLLQFIELNIREQDQSFFELPPNLKPMIMKMGIPQQGGETTPSAPATASTPSDGDLSGRQQACLEEAAKNAEAQRETAKKTKGLGRLLGKMSRTANRIGISNKLRGVSRAIYDANATAVDVADIADELGITTDDVERCKDPS